MEMTYTYSSPSISRLVQKNLAMAALGGSLLAGSWWGETYVMGGELKPVWPPYSLGCTRPEQRSATIVVASTAEDKCPADSPAPKGQ